MRAKKFDVGTVTNEWTVLARVSDKRVQAECNTCKAKRVVTVRALAKPSPRTACKCKRKAQLEALQSAASNRAAHAASAVEARRARLRDSAHCSWGETKVREEETKVALKEDRLARRREREVKRMLDRLPS